MSPIIVQGLAALVVVFFFILTYLNTKTWQWLHVTATFLVFAASLAFCVYAAMTLKTRAKWIKEHDDVEKRLATTSEELERVTRGDPLDVDGKTPSVYSVREDLARLVLDRGRVWRGCMPNINRQTGAVTVAISPPADPNNPTAAPAKKHNIADKTIVHVFREEIRPDPTNPERPMVVPVAYVGEFQAANPITDQTLTLQATIPLSQEQIATGQAQGTWSLYEVAPVDGHQWITGSLEERRNVFANAAGASFERIPQQQADKLVDSYVRDGTDEVKDTDSPENIWYEVKFTQEYEVTVDAPVVASLDAEPFNSEGQAVLEALRRGGANPDEAGKVKFGPAEGQIHTAVLDQQTAQSLIDRGVATLEKKIYRRPLNDYERKLRSINERITEINSRLRQLDLDKKSMITATEKANEQQAAIDELKGKINDDLTKVKYEVAELQKYSGALSDRLTAVQKELSQLYVSNKALARELARLTVEITEQADRRGREATARVP
jgi:hypothetical protein